ncbi:MAG: DUF4007 family protein [Pseudomonadota bacterium]
MIRDQLLNGGQYKPSFSGHETFPFRYGWLKKGFDEVADRENMAAFQMFKDTDAIATFGVGKNMVTSIRYWLNAVGLVSESSKAVAPSEFGHWLLGEEGRDPYLEARDSLFLIHWQLCGAPAMQADNHKTTSWYLVFNHFPDLVFDKPDLVLFLEEVIAENQWSSVATATLERDIDCLIRMYVPSTQGAISEESLDSPMSELGLIHKISERKKFGFNCGPKPTLSKRVFYYALMEFWSSSGEKSSLAIDRILHDPGSPGRVFKITKQSLAEIIDSAFLDTEGALDWTQTAGLSQLTLRKDYSPMDAYEAMSRTHENV